MKDVLVGIGLNVAAIVLLTVVVRQVLLFLGLPQGEQPPGLPTTAIDNLSLLAPVWIICVKWRGGTLADLGLLKPTTRGLVIGASLGIIFFALSSALFMALANTNQLSVAYAAPPSDEASFPLATVFLAGLVTPFSEELFYRGFAYAGFRKRAPFRVASAGSALLFGAMHLDLIVLAPFALFGYVLARLYEEHSSLWPSVVAHSAVNLAVVYVQIILIGRG